MPRRISLISPRRQRTWSGERSERRRRRAETQPGAASLPSGPSEEREQGKKEWPSARGAEGACSGSPWTFPLAVFRVSEKSVTGGVAPLLHVLTQQKLVGHSRNVVADNDATRQLPGHPLVSFR